MAPISPKIAPLAPAETVSVLKDKDKKFPKSPEIIYKINIFIGPIIASTILPNIKSDSIFINICSKLKCKNIEVISLYHSP